MFDGNNANRPPVPPSQFSKEISEKAKIFAMNLSASGYGWNYEDLLPILEKLSEKEIEILAYNCYRTAEKLGVDAFDCHTLYES